MNLFITKLYTLASDFHLLAQELIPGMGGGDTAPAPAPTDATAPQAQPPASIFSMMPMFLIIIFIFYFFIIRPQKKEMDEKQAMISKLKKNDRVVTQGGIIGTVFRVEKKEIILRVDDKNDIRMRFHPSAIISHESKDDKDNDNKTEDAPIEEAEAVSTESK